MVALTAGIVVVAAAIPPALEGAELDPEAVVAAFRPECPHRSERWFLTPVEAEEFASLYEGRPPRLLKRWRVACPEGTYFGYLDVDRVRTLPQALLVWWGPEGRLTRIEVLLFREPPEYRPPPPWLERFHGIPVSEAGRAARRTPPLTGASLTAAAVRRAVARTATLHRRWPRKLGN